MKIRFKKSTRVVFRGTLLSPDTNNECELPKALNNKVLIGKLLSRFRFLELVPEEGEVPESDIPNQSNKGVDTEVKPEIQESAEIDTFVDGSDSGTQESTEVANPEVTESESETQDSTEDSAEGEVELKD